MLQLKMELRDQNIRQSELAEALALSPATVAQIVNHGVWPRSLDEAVLQQQIRDFLQAKGAAAATLKGLFEEWTPPRADTAGSDSQEDTQEDTMLLRKQSLTQEARKQFGLFTNPFTDDVQSHEDLFVSADIRYVRESMYLTAKQGGFMAVVGESGAGKSTLRRDLIDRLVRESLPVIVIEPYILAMEDNDVKGKTLKASHIAEAILNTIAPLESVKRSPEARFRQLHRVLRDSSRAGHRHVLIIEEAHSLPQPTLKHLKRFFELEDGFRKLLSIILIGQPELALKLSEQNQEVREVVQRCEVVRLAPLDELSLASFIKFKFDRIGKALGEVIDASGIEAIARRLTISQSRRGQDTTSLLYPLAVVNLLTAAMNAAADAGFPQVTADVVKGV